MVQNEEEDFRLALSPEAPGGEGFSESAQEESCEQLKKPSSAAISSDNIPEGMETKELNGEPKISKDTDNINLDDDAAMPVSRKRPHSPAEGDKHADSADAKFARLFNGLSEDSQESAKKSEEGCDSKKDSDSFHWTAAKTRKSDADSDSMDALDCGDSRDSVSRSSDLTTKPEADSKDGGEDSKEVGRMDLSYLRKLHKGQVEKMSRNDLEELVVQKLCEAITERSQVGEMRLRCQALERGQEKWKDKYSQLQKQVRELNIVLKKFLSEQATALKEKTIPPTPVRITRSVGLQVALPGGGQRSLAALRLRQQREAPAASPTSVSSPASPASAPVTPTTPAVSAGKSSPSNRYVPVAQSPVRRLPEIKTPSPVTTTPPQRHPTPPQRQGIVPSAANTVLTASAPQPRVVAAPQPSLTLTRPQMVQVQTPMQATVMNSVRPRATANVNIRAQTVTNLLQQVQQPRQALQAHTSVSQVVVSSASSPQLGRLQVVLTPQQQQQILQPQQIVLRPPQSPAKDVEVIDLDKEDRTRQPTRVQQIQPVNTNASFAPNGNMTVRLLQNSQQVQLNSNQGKGRTNVVLKGVVQAMNTQANNALRKQVVPQGTLINSRGLTVVQQSQQTPQQMPQLQQLRPLRVTAHPAPLPPPPAVQPENPSWKLAPPKPSLKIQHTENGIVLSWNMNLYSTYEDIGTYQLYAYQEGASPPSSSLWKKVGDVKALPLPMACTLTQFAEGHRYHFAVRAVDIRNRVGPFSAPGNIRLEQKTQ